MSPATPLVFSVAEQRVIWAALTLSVDIWPQDDRSAMRAELLGWFTAQDSDVAPQMVWAHANYLGSALGYLHAVAGHGAVSVWGAGGWQEAGAEMRPQAAALLGRIAAAWRPGVHPAGLLTRAETYVAEHVGRWVFNVPRPKVTL